MLEHGTEEKGETVSGGDCSQGAGERTGGCASGGASRSGEKEEAGEAQAYAGEVAGGAGVAKLVPSVESHGHCPICG